MILWFMCLIANANVSSIVFSLFLNESLFQGITRSLNTIKIEFCKHLPTRKPFLLIEIMGENEILGGKNNTLVKEDGETMVHH